MEKLISEQFFVSTAFQLLLMLRKNEQKLSQSMLWVCNIVYGERGIALSLIVSVEILLFSLK